MSLCKHKDSYDELWYKWTNVKSNTFRLHGDGESSKKIFREWGETILEKPLHEDFILTEAEHARLNLELIKYNKRMNGDFINSKFEDYFFVPEGISLKDPVARAFYKTLNASINYERVNLSKANGLNKSISNHLRNAYINNNLQGKYKLGIKHAEKIQELQLKIQKSDNIKDRELLEEALGKVVDKDETLGPGSILNQYKELMKLSNSEFNSKGLKRESGELYDKDVLLAARDSRALLNEMGSVMKTGLSYLENAVKWKYLGTDNLKEVGRSIKYKNFSKRIKEAQDRIEIGMREGGYLPSYVMSDLIKVKEAMTDYMNLKNSDKAVQERRISTLEKTLDSINYEAIPEHARAANSKVKNLYNENPIFILQQYASDAIGFNKLSFIQSHYLKTMKGLSKSQNSSWLEGMKKWISEEFQIATDGLKDRPDWLNQWVRGIQGAQVVRTMGLNLTGAVVNATSIQFSAAHLGLAKIREASKQYLHGSTGQVDKNGNSISMRKLVDRVNEESGFLFNDVATELIAEGLLPSKGVNNKDFTFDVEKGILVDKGSPLKDKLKSAGNWTIEKSLFFHRITENFTRKSMFNTAFIDKYNQYTSQRQFVENLEYAGKKGYAAAEAKAKQWALEFVNRYAFEYAIHAKPKAARGINGVDTVGDKVVMSKQLAGAGGQLTFQLLHYPMSLMQQQSRNIRGGINAMRVGQWNASEAQYLYRYFALFTALQAGSIITNLNLNGLIPNETLERLKNIEDDFTVPLDERSKEETYGLISEVSGPMVGSLKWALLYGGILNTEDSYLAKVILGNVDFTKEPGSRLNWYQLSTEVGRWKSKTLPALQDGRGFDAFRHYLRMYPGELPFPGLNISTRDARKKLGLDKRKKRKKTDADAVLQALSRL